MLKQQPPDEWNFLRPDVLTDDGVLDTLIAANEVAPEEAALHLDRSLRHGPATDPGRAEVALDPDQGIVPPPVSYFDDEEPEAPGFAWPNDPSSTGASTLERASSDDDPDARADNDTFAEPDLEEILESQHYAFAPEDSGLDDPAPAETRGALTVPPEAGTV